MSRLLVAPVCFKTGNILLNVFVWNSDPLFLFLEESQYSCVVHCLMQIRRRTSVDGPRQLEGGPQTSLKKEVAGVTVPNLPIWDTRWTEAQLPTVGRVTKPNASG